MGWHQFVRRLCYGLVAVVAQLSAGTTCAADAAQKDRMAMGEAELTFTATGGSALEKVRFLRGPVQREKFGTVPVLEMSGEWVSSARQDKALNTKPLGASSNDLPPAAAAYDEVSDTGGHILASGELRATDQERQQSGVLLKAEAHLRDSPARIGTNAVALASYEQKFVLAPGASVAFMVRYSGTYQLDGVARGTNGMSGISVTLGSGPAEPNNGEPGPVVDSRSSYVDDAGTFSGVLRREFSNSTGQELVRIISVVLYAEVYNFQVLNPGMKVLPVGINAADRHLAAGALRRAQNVARL